MKKLFAFALIGAAIAGCTTCTDCCDDCVIKQDPQVVATKPQKSQTVPVVRTTKRTTISAPKCVVKYEFWGRKYLELTDVYGVVYKVTPPSSSITVRFVGKTGWYDLTSEGTIVRFKDPK